MASPLNLCICEGEQIAVVGDNAAGKTRLTDIITGNRPLQGDAIRYDFGESAHRLASDNIRLLDFRDSYGEADNSYYLQQRWNMGDIIEEDTPTVRQLLERHFGPESELQRHLIGLFRMEDTLDNLIISLSSGELRKFQLIKALLYQPRLLILDNPFLGLDAPTRLQLADFLARMAEDSDLTVILVLSRTDVMPGFITHIIPVEGLRVLEKTPVGEWMEKLKSVPAETCDYDLNEMESLPAKELESFYPQSAHSEILRFNHIGIRYGKRTIIRDLQWTVLEGERWALSGENGAGKSTLLSLVSADNPQGYACDIELFGHKRGQGESIWEIKRHIGYVSPEMHRAYRKDIPAIHVVASGLFDTIGLYTHPKSEQTEICMKWMRIFGISNLAQRSFLRLSSGEQRLCLLVRAFVKDPELLILDEPMHGLDEKHACLVRAIIDAFVRRPHKTLLMVTHFPQELPSCINRHLELKKQF